MPYLYRLADVFVLASHNEPYGRVLLESMACNTPVVAEFDQTRFWMVGGYRNVGGILIRDIKNIFSLSKGIEYAYHHDYKDKPRKQAERFGWDRTVDQYEEIFNKIL